MSQSSELGTSSGGYDTNKINKSYIYKHKLLLMEKRKERIDNLEETPYSHLPYSDFGDSMIDDKQQIKKKVFVSGCYDLLHSGHVEFFQQASRYGDLYVGIGSDATYLEYKHRKPMFPQEERLFMVKNIKAVKDAYINEGSGVIDFLPTLDKVKPDVFVVNAEGGSDEKRRICKERGIEYVELQRTPHAGLKARSSSDLKKALSNVSENSAQEAGISDVCSSDLGGGDSYPSGSGWYMD